MPALTNPAHPGRVVVRQSGIARERRRHGANARFLQKCGRGPGQRGVAAIGVNALVGAIVHAVLIVVFFAWSSTVLRPAFKLPSTSKLLAILAVLVAVVGVVMAYPTGRRFAKGPLVRGVRSAAGNLRQVARVPAR